MGRKKKYIVVGSIVAVILILLAGSAIFYLTQPNFRFINTRLSKKDKGPQYVKVKVDGSEEKTIKSNVDSGKNISVSEGIKQTQSLEEQTIQIDEMIQAELEKGEYSFEEPLVIQNPYQNSPLTAVAVFTTEEESQIKVTVKGKTQENDIADTIEATKQHIIPIIGLYANMENNVLLEELDKDGKAVRSTTLKIQTDSLPDAFIDAVKMEKKTTESSIKLMVVTGGAIPHLYGFDSSGDIRWALMYSTGANFGGYPLTNGHFLIESENTMMANAGEPRSTQYHEVDYLGRVYQDYFFTSGAHHEIKEKEPGGNLLVLSDSGKGYLKDLLQEYDRETGEVVKELNLRPLFKKSGYVNKADWAHTNTLSYDKETDSIIVNPRNLHSAVKINWSTDEIEWILGDPEFWEGTGLEDKVLQPEGDIQWHYQPHTVYQLEEDIDNDPNTIHVMLFDNHNDKNRKVEGFEKTGYSYVKLYTIDPEKMTVKQDHIYQCDYSPVTSNYLLDYDNKRVFAASAYSGSKKTGLYGTVTEYDFDSEEVLNQYKINHNYYRAYNIDLDFSSCLQNINVNDTYLKGQMRYPVKVDTKVEKPKRNLKSDSKAQISMSMLKDLLLFTAKNHSYTQVIFSGQNNTYIYDISDIKVRFEYSFVYAIPIPLTEFVADTYNIYIMCQDEYFNLNQSITIS
ncbi:MULTISPECIES: aryl-sulfate sulfotransferase [Robinsoniella]|uniref:aryl-sulfate sulfotransferase n=1 Tax=Robinsoniella TaxID=588605 RepID=UPI00048013F7|nr:MULTISPECIES: aryl-sulfate sulfotransferase [Robinsoniella]